MFCQFVCVVFSLCGDPSRVGEAEGAREGESKRILPPVAVRMVSASCAQPAGRVRAFRVRACATSARSLPLGVLFAPELS